MDATINAARNYDEFLASGGTSLSETMPDIRPARTNWQQFCQESPLTDEELAAYGQLRRAVLTAALIGSAAIKDFIFEATMNEFQELRRQKERPRTDDWSDVVAFADASRRLRRAEIAAWARWQSAARGGEGPQG